jgi:15-cis-phytoene synthase
MISAKAHHSAESFNDLRAIRDPTGILRAFKSGGAQLPMQDNFSYCEQLVREADKDRFLASLFAPGDRRSPLFALYAFNVEVARVREVVREPLAGEVRLQWWRDALEGRTQGETRANPVAAALLDTITRFNLPIAPLVSLIDARTFDLYDDPMTTLPHLERYARRTSSVLIELASAILCGHEQDLGETASHAGVAYAVAGLLRAFPIHAARGQLYVPSDLLERHGIAHQDIYSGKATAGLLAALAEMRQRVRHHLAELDEWHSLVPPEASPAFLPVALVPPLLATMERPSYDPFKLVTLSQWRRQWALWRAARRDFPGG